VIPALLGATADAPAVAPVITVRMSECAVAGGETLLRCVGLGSCIAITIFAPGQQLAALAHCMLPERDGGEGGPGKFVDTAVPYLLTVLRESGASEPFAATLVGAASMFAGLGAGFVRDIAEDNLVTARAMLAESAVPIRSEDTGGHIGRSVLVDPATQRVNVHTIRHGDRCL